MYRFATLDPRNVPAATEANEKVFSTDCGICLHSSGQLDGEGCRYCGGTGKVALPVLGIEVTVPVLATRCCLGNIDPQHSGGDANRAAIEDALTAELPAEGSTLATVRADLDAIGTMAIFNLRASGAFARVYEDQNSQYEFDCRVAMVATSDKFARGGYQGPKPLPTRENPWDETSATAESSRPLAAIAAAVMDFKVSLADRVATMEKWLLTGEEPKQYRDSVEKERLDMITALESGAIKHETRADGRIAVVESTHRAATSVGYSLAPVVVALNPQFRFQGGEPHVKYTVCQFQAGYVDLKTAAQELGNMEVARLRSQGVEFPLDPITGQEKLPSWGGSPTIIGSPQGQGSTLLIKEVTEVVSRHLLK